jgi:hypothetical protein
MCRHCFIYKLSIIAYTFSVVHPLKDLFLRYAEFHRAESSFSIQRPKMTNVIDRTNHA